MNFKIQPNVPRAELDTIKFDFSADYQASGIQLNWGMSSDDPQQQFGFRILSSRDESGDGAGGSVSREELDTTGSYFISDLLSSYQIVVECYDLADTSRPLAFIVIEDLVDT
jgi:hypothetical protein